jgi:trehalose-6-phosphate synthase
MVGIIMSKDSQRPKKQPFMVDRTDTSKGVSVRAATEEEAIQKARKWIGDGPAKAKPIAGNARDEQAS